MTNQNKDYSWLSTIIDDLSEKAEGYGTGPSWGKYVSETKAKIQQKIDEHYIGKGEAETYKALASKQLKKLNAGIFAVQFYLNTPFPDDERWTPWTRFVQPRLKMLSEAVFNGREIGELAAMAHPDQDPPKSKLFTEQEVEQRCIEARLDELSRMQTTRHYGKDYQESLDDLDEYKDGRITELSQLSTNNKDTLERSGDESI